MTEPINIPSQVPKETESYSLRTMREMPPIEAEQLNALRKAAAEVMKQRHEMLHSSNMEIFEINMKKYSDLVTAAIKPVQSTMVNLERQIQPLKNVFSKVQREYMANLTESMKIAIPAFKAYQKKQQPFAAWMEHGWMLTVESEVPFRKSFEEGDSLTDDLALELLKDVDLIGELSQLVGNENERYQDIAFCFEHERYSLACLTLMERLESRISRAQLDSGIRLDKIKTGKSGLSSYMEDFMEADITAIDIHRFLGIEKMTNEIFMNFPKKEEDITPLNRNLLFHGLTIEKASKVEALKLLCLLIAVIYLEQGLSEMAKS